MEWGELWAELSRESLKVSFPNGGVGALVRQGVAGGCLAVYKKKCWQGQAGDQEAEL